MARKSSSIIEDLFDISAKLPPWLGLVLAVLSYVFCRHLSLIEVTPSVGMENVAQVVWGTFLRVFGMAGKFLLPIIFCLGALASLIRRVSGKRLVRNIKKQSKPIEKISWREFELVVTTLLRNEGFVVADNFDAGPDGGIDQVLHKNGKKYLVQCKHWKKQKVGVSVAREMFGLMVAEGADEAWIVTSGGFTQEAKTFSQGKPLRLVDGKSLERLSSRTSDNTLEVFELPTNRQSSEPGCPKCGASMVMRLASKGANAGKHFYGCSKFPSCRGIRSIN